MAGSQVIEALSQINDITSQVKNNTQNVHQSIEEIVQGSSVIDKAAIHVNELSEQNKNYVESLEGEMKKFKLEKQEESA